MLFSRGRHETGNTGILLRARDRTKAPGKVVFHLGGTDIAFGLIVRKWHLRLASKGHHGRLVCHQTVGQVSAFRPGWFPGQAPALRRRLFPLGPRTDRIREGTPPGDMGGRPSSSLRALAAREQKCMHLFCPQAALFDQGG
jgi:hypothetical protein